VAGVLISLGSSTDRKVRVLVSNDFPEIK
jgi:hypothetical protein